jgi:hypothetical protein
MPSPLFTGLSQLMQHLPFVEHALSRNCVATRARGGTPGNLPCGPSVRLKARPGRIDTGSAKGWTWRWRHNHYFWQDSSGNMLNPVVGLLEFIAEGPAVAALQGALLPSSKLEAATIENYQVDIVLGRPHAGRQQQGRQGGDRTDCARATPKPQHRITWTRSRATPNPGAWSPNSGRSRF